MGNASSADAGEVFLKITKNSANNAVNYLNKYKSLGSKSASPSGGAFSPSKPNLQSPLDTSCQREELPHQLRIPAMFSDSGLLSSRAIETINRVENFIAENVLPR